MSSEESPALEWIADRRTLRLTGAWTTPALGPVSERIAAFSPEAAEVILDAGHLAALDTAGALLLHRLRAGLAAQGRQVAIEGMVEGQAELLELVAARAEVAAEMGPPVRPGLLERTGRAAVAGLEQAYTFLSFMGSVFLTLLANLRHPSRLRGRAILAVVQNDGINAMPVLGMLSFLLGVVIAYQAGIQLRAYGGNLYIVDLVTLTVLRELAPLMTAIIVAGRSGSAYTAQIGTMQVTEEVDALRSIGIPPEDLLVLPKLLGLILTLPLLTVYADVLAVFGGMVMAEAILDVRFETFIERIPEAVTLSSFYTGVGKAPVFAAVIAVAGCFQGFQVSGGADSVGRHTTTSVVQAIVLVIVTDAAFSVAFSWLGI